MSNHRYFRVRGHKGYRRLIVAAVVAGLTGPVATAEPSSAPTGEEPAVLETVTEPRDPASVPPTYSVLQDRPGRLMATLPNRLIVIAQEVRTAPVVSAQVWIKTGSLFEQEHVGAGLSHFLEHLLAGGSTTTRTEQQTNEILGSIGAATNAATSLDTVRYYINTTSEHTETAVDLLGDWMLNSEINEREFNRERSVIQREFEMGQGDPSRILWKLSLQARFGDAHPAKHPTIGYLDEFLTITRDEIYDFYKRMYVPNNMVVVVVGDIDKTRVVKQVAAIWADAEAGPLPEVGFPQETRRETPLDTAGRASIATPRLRMIWPGTQLAGEGDYEMDIVAQVLGDGEASRLVRTVRDEQRRVDSIDAYNVSFAWGRGLVGVDATVAVPPIPPNARATPDEWRDKHVNEARDAIAQQVRALCSDGVTDQELARAKRRALAGVVYSGQTAQAMASRLASDLIGMNDPDYLQRYAQAIQKITAEEVKAAANRYLRDDALITVTLLPTDDTAQVTPMSRANGEQTKPRVDDPYDLDNRRVLAQLQDAPDPNDTKETITVGPVREHTLPNGLKLLVSRSTVVPAASIQFYQLGGLLSDEPGREGLSNAVALMRQKGTETRTAQQLAREVEDLGARLSTGGGNNTSYTRAVCLAEDVSEVMTLVADVVRHPAFPEDEWQKLKPRLLSAIAREQDSWAGELRARFREVYFDGHPWSRSIMGSADSVTNVTADELRESYHQRLSAEESVLAVFGDVDPDRVIELAEQLFAELPANIDASFKPTNPDPRPAGVTQAATEKPLAAVQIGFGPGVTRGDPDFPSLQVLARVISSFPSGWLEQELRGRGPGLVYAVHAGQITGLVPGCMVILFNTQPQSVPEAITRSLAVADRARQQLVDAPTLTRAKAKVLAEQFMGLQTNSDRATDAALNELYGLGNDARERFRDAVNGLTAEGLQQAAIEHMRDPVVVVLTHEPQDQEGLEKLLEPDQSAAVVEPMP